MSDDVREELIKSVCKILGCERTDTFDTSRFNTNPKVELRFKIEDMEIDALVFIEYLYSAAGGNGEGLKPLKHGDKMDVKITGWSSEEMEGNWGKTYKMFRVDFERDGNRDNYKSPSFSPSGKLLSKLKVGDLVNVTLGTSARGYLEWVSVVEI